MALATDKDRYRPLKIVLDLMSVLAIAFLLVVVPISAHYDSKIHGSDGNLLPIVRAMFADGPLFVFGLGWLIYRHFHALAIRYPFLKSQRFWIVIQLLTIPFVWLVMGLARIFWK